MTKFDEFMGGIPTPLRGVKQEGARRYFRRPEPAADRNRRGSGQSAARSLAWRCAAHPVLVRWRAPPANGNGRPRAWCGRLLGFRIRRHHRHRPGNYLVRLVVKHADSDAITVVVRLNGVSTVQAA